MNALRDDFLEKKIKFLLTFDGKICLFYSVRTSIYYRQVEYAKNIINFE